MDTAPVRIKRRKWFPFQPVGTLMAPTGHIHYHPRTPEYCDDFSLSGMPAQGRFLHEMTHVWQTQRMGRWYLPLMRHPFCRYDYSLKPGWKLERYGLEQQAEIVRHAFLLRNGWKVAGVSDAGAYELLVTFTRGRE